MNSWLLSSHSREGPGPDFQGGPAHLLSSPAWVPYVNSSSRKSEDMQVRFIIGSPAIDVEPMINQLGEAPSPYNAACSISVGRKLIYGCDFRSVRSLHVVGICRITQIICWP